jgi:hypothetical protein
MRSIFGPASRRTVSRRMRLPAKNVTTEAKTMPMREYRNPSQGPNAITLASVIRGRGNMTKQAGV